MSDFQRTLAKELEDPEFRQLWEESEADYQLQCALIEARIEEHMTQADLAKATGISQQSISRLETGEMNPTLKTLSRIAKGLNRKVQINFV